MRTLLLSVALLCLAGMVVPALASGGETIIEMPESGTDISTFRCQGNIVSTDDTIAQVTERCGEPVARGQVPNRTYDVWVYSVDGAVYYLGFRNRRLERIYSVSCVLKDPYCQ